MTTVLYKNNKVYSDGRVCLGHDILDEEYPKFCFNKDRSIVAAYCGVIEQAMELIMKIDDPEYVMVPDQDGWDFQAFVFDKRYPDIYTFFNHGLIGIERPRKKSNGIGSGAKYAMGAMDALVTPSAALHIAHKHDIGTGSNVYVIDLEKDEWEPERVLNTRVSG
jgi:ATP-dependent protease HslVU (ClpYQ) peptidase subunit